MGSMLGLVTPSMGSKVEIITPMMSFKLGIITHQWAPRWGLSLINGLQGGHRYPSPGGLYSRETCSVPKPWGLCRASLLLRWSWRVMVLLLAEPLYFLHVFQSDVISGKHC